MRIIFLGMLCCWAISSFAQQSLLKYETSNFRETGSYEETINYCKELDKRFPEAKYQSFGISPQGRELPLLIVDKDALFSPEKIQQKGKAIVWIQACIHAGESDGKDAILLLIKDLLETKKIPENICILFIPILNVDGHENFGPYNRINQNGPEEMGWRCTAQHLNLNRDYLKIDSPELQASLALFNAYNPDFFIDCHTTDGADYQYVLTYGIEVHGNMDTALSEWQSQAYLPYVEEKMFAENMPIFPYVAFKEWHNPKSGLRTMISPPMLSHGYCAIRNRPSLLIETHMLKDYKTRVDATYKMVAFSLDFINQDFKTLRKLNQDADKKVSSPNFRDKPYPLSFSASDKTDTVDFLGISYITSISELTGGKVFYYQKGQKEKMRLPLYNDIISDKEVLLPDFYIIPPEWTAIISRLQKHGVKMEKLKEEKEYRVVTYRFSDMKWENRPYEGRIRMDYQYKADTINMLFPKNSALIDMNQATALIAAHILEVASPSAFVHWGFFNTIFEQKEYSETYVMEPMALEMLEKDAKLKAAYEKKKAEDEQFANNQWLQMNWFYQQTPYWDERINRYPIGKIFLELNK